MISNCLGLIGSLISVHPPPDNLPSLLLRTTLNILPDLQRKLRQPRQRDIFARVKRAEDLGDCRPNLLHQFPPTPVKQPPAEGKIAPIGFKVISKCLSQIIIIMVLKADRRRVSRRCRQGDDTREVTPASKKIELNSSEDSQ